MAFDLPPETASQGPQGSDATPAGGYLGTRSLRLRELAAARGALLRPLGDVLYAMPPASTTPEQCQLLGEVLVELAADA